LTLRKLGEIGWSTARWVKQFIRSKRANTAMIFALASVSLVSAGGAGIDLSRVVDAKSRLAEALDAAALAVGTTHGLTNDQLRTMAQQYFDANYPVNALGTHNPVNVAVEGQTITLSVTGTVPTTLLQILHINDFDLAVTNRVVKSVTKLRVALVLDNTGSMSEVDNTGTSKISALKTATHQLLGQLQGAAINPGDVQVSIIPFSLDVNAGNGNPAATWIDWTNFDAAPPNSMPSQNYGPKGDAINANCPYATGTSPFGYGCLHLVAGKIAPANDPNYPGRIYPATDNGNYNSGRGGHHYNGYYDSVAKAGCVPGHATCTYTHTWHPTGHAAWTGCFMDRNQSYDTNNSTPAIANPNSLFPAELNDYCPPVALNALSFDWPTLNAKVDQMTPNGSTNQTIGLAWGWQALTTGSPLDAPAPDPLAQNVIVLLSDGLNTQDRWYGNGVNSNANVDARMALACANAKTAGVRIYTVLVMAGNSSVLKSCATDNSKYFELTTAGQIVTAFTSIGTELANLHLSL
jgi:Flp pilus assembly protein TadG